MKKSYLTISLAFIFVAWQFFTIESLEAETAPVDNKSTDASLPVQHPVIFFENSGFNFGQIIEEISIKPVNINFGSIFLQCKGKFQVSKKCP